MIPMMRISNPNISNPSDRLPHETAGVSVADGVHVAIGVRDIDAVALGEPVAEGDMDQVGALETVATGVVLAGTRLAEIERVGGAVADGRGV